MTILLAVIVGYALASGPRLIAWIINRQKPTFSGEKAREPTETEVRKAQRTVKEYMNFMTYDGTEQDDIITD